MFHWNMIDHIDYSICSTLLENHMRLYAFSGVVDNVDHIHNSICSTGTYSIISIIQYVPLFVMTSDDGAQFTALHFTKTAEANSNSN